MPEELKTVIFRVLQEALNNISKHSKADSIHLFLDRKEDRIRMVVVDNGSGFNIEDVLSDQGLGKGFGLTSMRERTEFSGGVFSIESAEGKGTRINAVWPL